MFTFQDPFEFSPHHEAIREPFDYFMFGQNYIRPLIDFRSVTYGMFMCLPENYFVLSSKLVGSQTALVKFLVHVWSRLKLDF